MPAVLWFDAWYMFSPRRSWRPLEPSQWCKSATNHHKHTKDAVSRSSAADRCITCIGRGEIFLDLPCLGLSPAWWLFVLHFQGAGGTALRCCGLPVGEGNGEGEASGHSKKKKKKKITQGKVTHAVRESLKSRGHRTQRRILDSAFTTGLYTHSGNVINPSV